MADLVNRANHRTRPDDVQVVELHDCFTSAEAVFSEALDLCPVGVIERYVADGDNTYGGKHVVNHSGGLLSKLSGETHE